MARRITHTHGAARHGTEWTRTRSGKAVVVVADSGASADILVFAPDEPVGKDVEFSYRGTTWVITGVHRDSGVLVAEPVSH